MRNFRHYILMTLFLSSFHFSSAQNISKLYSDSVYKPLLKAAQKYIFKNKYNFLLHQPLEWYLESYQDTNNYEFPYYKVDTLRNLFSKKDFGEQANAIVINDWNGIIKKEKLESEIWSPHLWSISIPIFSLDRQYALMLGTYTRLSTTQGYMLLFRLEDKKHWKLINVIID